MKYLHQKSISSRCVVSMVVAQSIDISRAMNSWGPNNLSTPEHQAERVLKTTVVFKYQKRIYVQWSAVILH